MLEGFNELDAQRERQLLSGDVDDTLDDEEPTPYEQQRADIIEAERESYYGDTGVLP